MRMLFLKRLPRTGLLLAKSLANSIITDFLTFETVHDDVLGSEDISHQQPCREEVDDDECKSKVPVVLVHVFSNTYQEGDDD